MRKKLYNLADSPIMMAHFRFLLAGALLALLLIWKSLNAHVVEVHPKLPSEIYEEEHEELKTEEKEINEILKEFEFRLPAREEQIEEAKIYTNNE